MLPLLLLLLLLLELLLDELLLDPLLEELVPFFSGIRYLLIFFVRACMPNVPHLHRKMHLNGLCR